jgi:hypothetical protein
VKEDVLEQIVDDYLKFQGYFTAHNIPFGPERTARGYDSRLDSVRSDIDVIGVHPLRRGRRRVIVVNCKAWQRGFNATGILRQLNGDRPNPKRARWKQFRELWIPKWSRAFRDEVERRTGAKTFTYRIAVTKLHGDPDLWARDRTIKKRLPGCDVGFLPLEEMWQDVLADTAKRPAASEMGRLAQLLKAAQLTSTRE